LEAESCEKGCLGGIGGGGGSQGGVCYLGMLIGYQEDEILKLRFPNRAYPVGFSVFVTTYCVGNASSEIMPYGVIFKGGSD